eukprot:CAMPEP_0197576286 /NCGR_PEP_ID=MMETSP1326-20131121/1360_1 /TAXON_ID=1155430 /ORGANISM="Genus nov. species nov., Strain RCC2288" /LENGTH=76 /DNA_ID=CAMNT_0043139169 /DNA_START=46 /DNA_END=272 /DNA_ORIENTATION=+
MMRAPGKEPRKGAMDPRLAEHFAALEATQRVTNKQQALALKKTTSELKAKVLEVAREREHEVKALKKKLKEAKGSL